MFRAVRRPSATALLVPALLVATLVGCGASGQPKPYHPTGVDTLEIPTPSPAPTDFVAGVDNDWLAWEPGTTRRFGVTDSGESLGTWEVEVARHTVVVGGIDATVVIERSRLEGESVVESTGYYAQDVDGHVWWLGGEGQVAWRFDDSDAGAGLVLPAEPRLGDGWVSAVLPEGDVVTRVLDNDLAGEWEDAVKTSFGADSEQLRYYVSGLGLVRVVDPATGRTYEPIDEEGD